MENILLTYLDMNMLKLQAAVCPQHQSDALTKAPVMSDYAKMTKSWKKSSLLRTEI